MQRSVTVPSHVIIATHTLFYGASEALRDYLRLRQACDVVYIGNRLRPDAWPFPYIIDIAKIFAACFALPQKPYVFIGVNPANALVGILLQKIGRVDRVIFYAIDFVPRRFRVPILNRLYHAVESFAVKNATVCWNVSPMIAVGRKTFLGIDPQRYPQMTVPIGVWKRDIVRTIKHTNDHRIVFAGHLLEKQGVHLVLEALSMLQHLYPKIRFTVIGGGEYEKQLMSLCRRLHIDSVVRFLGWVSDQKKIQRELTASDIAVAVYSEDGSTTSNFTYYADPTKLKTYLSCGLPIIMTRVPYNAKELSLKGAAFLVRYDPKKIAETISMLFESKHTLLAAKSSARKAAFSYTWEHIFDTVFATL